MQTAAQLNLNVRILGTSCQFCRSLQIIHNIHKFGLKCARAYLEELVFGIMRGRPHTEAVSLTQTHTEAVSLTQTHTEALSLTQTHTETESLTQTHTKAVRFKLKLTLKQSHYGI